MLSALLCAVNRPECSDVAFVDDEKYISCEVEVGGEETGCEGYSAQTALSLGGDVEWCIFTGDNVAPECFCINATSFISSDAPTLPSDLGRLNISSTGVLYIPNVNVEMRGGSENAERPASCETRVRVDRPATCTVFHEEGRVCQSYSPDILIFQPGKLMKITVSQEHCDIKCCGHLAS